MARISIWAYGRMGGSCIRGRRYIFAAGVEKEKYMSSSLILVVVWFVVMILFDTK